MTYPILVVELLPADGGGYLGLAPDLPGCMGDGATQEAALKNTQDAIMEWLSAAKASNRPIPEPGSVANQTRDRESALIRTIKVMSEHYDSADERIVRLDGEIEHLRAVIEGEAAWSRMDHPVGREMARKFAMAG